MRRDWKRSVGLAKIRPQWAFALRAVPYRKTFTTDFFMELTGASRGTARDVLRSYQRSKFCMPGSKAGTWIKLVQPVPLASQIIAIEAKLVHWQRALAQAYRYLDYATESWVLLDAGRANGAIRSLKTFRRLNVGLMTLSPNSQPKPIYTPKKQKPKSPIRYWHVLSALGRRGL